MIKINGREVSNDVLRPIFSEEDIEKLMNKDTLIELDTNGEEVGNVVYIGGHQTLAVNGSDFAHQKFTPNEFETTMARLPYADSESDYRDKNEGSGMAQMKMFVDIMKALDPSCSDDMDKFLEKLRGDDDECGE